MAPTHTLIQVSDVHIGPPGGTGRDPVDTAVLLTDALRAVEQAQIRPTAIVVTGDVTESGVPAEYERFRRIADPALARLGAPMLVAVGNHDDRRALRTALLGETSSEDPLDYVTVLDGLRIIVLDSSVPGEGYGLLGADQLAWLRSELARPAPSGTVLALHHPPLPSPAPLAAAVELQARERLAAAIRGSDVRIVLAGHTHVVSAGSLGGAPVWTGGALATTLDGLAPGAALRGVSTPTVSRVDLFADDLVVTSVPIGERTLTSVSSRDMEQTIADLRRRLPV